MIGQDWKVSSPFFLAENLVLLVWKIPLENMENSAHGKSGGKSADPVQLRKICGKIGKSAENLENLECKVYLTFHGKSDVRHSAENLTLICLENLQKMLALFIVMW